MGAGAGGRFGGGGGQGDDAGGREQWRGRWQGSCLAFRHAIPAAASSALPPQLRGSTHGLYADTVSRLEGALAAVCADFRPSHYTKVLEGYMFLGNVGQVGVGGASGCGPGGSGSSAKSGGVQWQPRWTFNTYRSPPTLPARRCAALLAQTFPLLPSPSTQLGDEVQSAFIATIATSSAKVVRGVLLTRPGAEDKAAVAGNLQVGAAACERHGAACAHLAVSSQCSQPTTARPRLPLPPAHPDPCPLRTQELVRFLPSDLFRTCLARVLMVLFDILVSHFHMVRNAMRTARGPTWPHFSRVAPAGARTARTSLAA